MNGSIPMSPEDKLYEQSPISRDEDEEQLDRLIKAIQSVPIPSSKPSNGSVPKWCPPHTKIH